MMFNNFYNILVLDFVEGLLSSTIKGISPILNLSLDEKNVWCGYLYIASTTFPFSMTNVSIPFLFVQ